MRRRPLMVTVIPVAVAAVLGNTSMPQAVAALVSELRQPRLAVPFPAFVTVGASLLRTAGVVRYGTVVREDVAASRAVQKPITSIFSKLGLAASDDDHRRVLAVLAYTNPAG